MMEKYQNIAAMLTEAKTFKMMPRPLGDLGDNDVLIEIKHVGICGSDVSVFEDPTIGGMFNDLPLPILLGHECGGIIKEVGKKVKDLKPGDAVAVEPGVPCGKCEACMSGNYNLCDDVLFMAAPPWQTGALCKYIIHPRQWVFKLPDNLTTLEGALMEPFCVGMKAAMQGQINACKSVVILGGGCIGMMTALACRANGVSNITIVDLFDSHLQIAQRMGFTKLVNSSKGDLVQKVLDTNDGQKLDVVFETAGSPVTAALTPDLCKRGGTIVLVGNIHKKVDFNFWNISFNQITVKTVFRYNNLYPACIQTASAGQASLKDIGIRIFPFERTQEAFECALTDKINTLKVVVSM